MNFQDLELMDDQLELMSELSKRFFSRAHQVDIDGSFPYDNIQDLKRYRLHLINGTKEVWGKRNFPI